MARVLSAIALLPLLASSAFGYIVYTDIADVHLSTFGQPVSGQLSYPLDVDGDTVADINFRLSWNLPNYSASSVDTGTSPTRFNARFVSGQGIAIVVMTAGQTVQPVFGNSGGTLRSFNKTAFGDWNGAGYMGFSLGTSAATSRAGWMDLVAFNGDITIRRFAYETTPGVPIVAGAIPAPSAALIVTIGGLVVARRKRP